MVAEHVPAQGNVRFEAVSFSYGEETRPVLQDGHLESGAGETLALVGASGSGKTTLAMLLPRLRTTVATAFEEPILFSASVRENVTLGRPGATEAKLEACPRRAGSGNGWPRPGRCWAARRCWCSTRRPPRWTSPASDWSSGRSARSCASARR